MKHLREYIIEQQTVDEGLWQNIKKMAKKFFSWLSGEDSESDIDKYSDYDYDFSSGKDKYSNNKVKFHNINLHTLKTKFLDKKHCDEKEQRGWWQTATVVNQFAKYITDDSDTLEIIDIIYENTVCGLLIYDVDPEQFRIDMKDKAHNDSSHIYSLELNVGFTQFDTLYKYVITTICDNINKTEGCDGVTATYLTDDIRKIYTKMGFKECGKNLMEIEFE